MKALLAAGLTVAVWTGAASAGPRVVSLDQCADQYVLALSDRNDIAALSPRARAADAWLRQEAEGLPLHRPSLEAVIAERPQVVVRQWGGGPRLDAALQRLGVGMVSIGDAQDFDGVRRNIRSVAKALGHPERGETLILRMDAQLAASKGAWGRRGGLYLTDGAFTAGKGTLVDAILRAAGLTNLAARSGYMPAPLERVMLNPPAVIAFGRFEAEGHGRWSPVRGETLSRALSAVRRAELPGALLGCPAWFAGEAVARLAAAAR